MPEEESVLTNQTQFSYEEPYRESSRVVAGEAEPATPKPNSKKKLIILVGIGIFLLFFVLILLAAMRPKQIEVGQFQQPVFATPVPVEVSPLLERVNRLEAELQDADPVKQSLVFPPVDMEIRLDPKK